MAFTTLMYHEIREKAAFDPGQPSSIEVKQNYNDILPPVLFVYLENFKEQMAYLKNQGYHTLTLEQVKNYYLGEALPEKSVLLTFDDCYQSMKRYAYPILKDYGFHAIAFVVTGWLQDTQKEFNPSRSVCLAEGELSELTDVFEFANHTDLLHTRSNPTVSSLMASSDEIFAEDLDRCNSKAYLSARDVFAYPFGLYENRNIEVLKKKGFQLAFTSEPGRNDKATSPFLLKRNAVPYFMELSDYTKLLP